METDPVSEIVFSLVPFRIPDDGQSLNTQYPLSLFMSAANNHETST
jgi:hypothetical protein